MDGSSWDVQGAALGALRTIVADPRYGPVALSNSQTLGYLLGYLLPSSQRETGALVAAAEAGAPWTLQNYIAQGMSLDSACRQVAGYLGERSALPADGCTWAVGALASALGLEPASQLTQTIHLVQPANPAQASPQPGDATSG